MGDELIKRVNGGSVRSQHKLSYGKDAILANIVDTSPRKVGIDIYSIDIYSIYIVYVRMYIICIGNYINKSQPTAPTHAPGTVGTLNAPATPRTV